MKGGADQHRESGPAEPIAPAACAARGGASKPDDLAAGHPAAGKTALLP
jgi:hypothetical protein